MSFLPSTKLVDHIDKTKSIVNVIERYINISLHRFIVRWFSIDPKNNPTSLSCRHPVSRINPTGIRPVAAAAGSHEKTSDDDDSPRRLASEQHDNDYEECPLAAAVGRHSTEPPPAATPGENGSSAMAAIRPATTPGCYRRQRAPADSG